MKKTLFALYFIVCSYASFASHITGGEMTYEYIGPGSQANTRSYRITLKLFRDEHTTGAPMPSEVFIGIFNNDNNSQFPSSGNYFNISKTSEQNVSVNPYPPCVNNVPDLHYNVGSYTFVVELPDNTQGYAATYQTCCRVSPLMNVYNTVGSGSGGTGSTYSCVIPPIIDNSPKFASNIDLICLDREFTLDFSAKDTDGDSLVYSFSEAFDGGSARNANNINPARPPYSSVDYINGFSYSKPLGDLAFINPLTGIITGTAPGLGKYVVCVSVKSYKNSKYIGEHRKDFIINVGDCDFAGAQLNPKPITCDGFSVAFNNDNNSALNKTFFWTFGDPESGALNTSTLATPVHQFSDTGVYVYKLVVNKGEACSDSTTQIIKVYPGFFPGFTSEGQCKNTPIRFTDTTKTNYGIVDSWIWNFGDTEILEDTSRLKNPSFIFTRSDNYDVQLIVTSSKGCIDTFNVIKTINDQPEFYIPNDTLICSIDTLTLNGIGNGKFFWTPDYNINNQTANSPLVSPDVPTQYYASFSDAFGCDGLDSVFVDVKRFVTLNAGNDTSICRGDPVQLNAIGDALHYKWTPTATLDNDIIKSPVAIPLTSTTYSLTGSIGKCQTTDLINIKVTPYPLANAGADSTICIGSSAQLNSSGGTIYKWSPGFFLNNVNIPNPVANPENDIMYVVSVSDTLGCPKSVSDSVLIKVLNVIADAGPRDTSVVMNQPLQLSASGGEFYLWNPATGLNATEIADPVARLSNDQQYTVIATSAGCSDIDTINVTVYKIDPGLYIPTAFTPDKNGINDVFRPIPIGMKNITYFRVYNRWGQLMFSTATKGKGWDGTFSGKPQDAGVYVWMIEGIDYLDSKIIRKGSVILIR